MYLNQRVAVAALVQQFQLEPKRGAPIALSDNASIGCEYRHQGRRQVAPESAGVAVRRVKEHQIVLTSGRACPAEECRRRLTADLGLHLKRRQVALDRR